jgi:hypothetical protein
VSPLGKSRTNGMTRSTEFSDAADYLIHSHDQAGELLEFKSQPAGWECRWFSARRLPASTFGR